MEISYKLDRFEGPLDLLLYLIERDRIDIYDIPIVSITEQYLNYMNHLETDDLDLMSEFIVMATTLLDIKRGCSCRLKKMRILRKSLIREPSW